MKHPIRYRLEFWLARLLWTLFASLPVARASALGAGLGAVVGYLPGLKRRAERNLRLAMPELDPGQRAAIIAGVWRNLGRTLAELPHTGKFTLIEGPPEQGQIQIVGAERLRRYPTGGILLFGGHLANWELAAATFAKLGRPMHVVYRAANNPLIDRWLRRYRQDEALSALAKGRSAARGILAALRKGDAVAMLVDQKMNDGIQVPFFGRPAMTAPALAQLALRLDVPVLPVRCERLSGAAFRITILPALRRGDGDDRSQNVAAMMTEVNHILEQWIRARPEQWLWLHNRWPRQDEPG